MDITWWTLAIACAIMAPRLKYLWPRDVKLKTELKKIILGHAGMYSLTSFFLVLTNSQPLNSTQISTQQRFYGTNHFFERGIWPGGDSLENLRKLQRDTMTLSCGRGLKCFSSLKGTNSYITHYLLSYFFFGSIPWVKRYRKSTCCFF